MACHPNQTDAIAMTSLVEGSPTVPTFGKCHYQKLRKHVEFLFSDQNLDVDEALSGFIEMEANGWIDIPILLNHINLKSVAPRRGQHNVVDIIELCNELNTSKIIQVRAGDVPQVRRLQPYVKPPRVQLPMTSKFPKDEGNKWLEDTEVSFPIMSAAELAPLTVSVNSSLESLMDVFAEHGCCLVTDVLNERECESFERLWQLDLLNLIDSEGGAAPAVLEALEHVRREGCRAWPASWAKLLGSKGCASQLRMPHSHFAWASRLHPKVRHVFAQLFETPENEMAVGFDVVFFAATDTPGATSNAQWLHVDQNHCSGMTHPCAQGVLYVWPSTDDCASTTVLWPGSHRDTYEKLMSDAVAVRKGRKLLGSQSVRINDLEDAKLRDELAAKAIAGSRRVPCPAGSLLLWDSRLVHQGWSGGPRLAQPVCWEPRCRRDGDALRRKLQMVVAGMPSSHSSSEGRVHGMARCGKPTPLKATANRPAVRLSIPYGVAPGCEEEWNDMQDSLWPSAFPDKNAAMITPEQCSVVQQIIREEVLAAC